MTVDRTLRAALAMTLALAPAGVLTACGGDDDGGSAEEPKTLAISATESGKNTRFTVPDSIESGVVRLTLTNEGKKGHNVQLIKVDGDQTAAQVLEVLAGEGGKIPTWVHGAGGLGEVAAGETGTSTQKLEPGTYYVIDEELEDDNSVASTAKFTVTGVAAEGELPDAPATITASEYKFETSGLKPGANTVKFENVGKELHHALAFPLREGAKTADVLKFFTSERESDGPPPIQGEPVGTIVIDGGVSQVINMNLKARNYVLVCFVPDRAGGPPHAAKGMISELKVG